MSSPRPAAGSETAALAVITVSPSNYDAVRRTISYLRRQTIASRLELVIVAPQAEGFGLVADDLCVFASYRLVEIGPIRSTGGAMAAGFLAATAPIVAYAEQHLFPDPTWAEALLDAHQGPFAAVAYVVRTANGANSVAWGAHFLDFGRWAPLTSAQEMSLLPHHYVTYKRSAITPYGDSLGALIEGEDWLIKDLIEAGHRVVVTPAATGQHVNISRMGSLALESFHSGRVYGAYRPRHGRWSRVRRIAYAAGSPLVPLVKLKRTLTQVRRCSRQDLLPAIVPAILVASAGLAAGEAVGYLRGEGRSIAQLCTFELDRASHMTRRDCEWFLGGAAG